MNELDKAYETAEMLKALDLPISKAQLENIERLEKENGKEHREDLSSYFFEKCFANYTKRIMNIRQAKIRGEVIVAKPVLLLAIIDGISNDLFKDNRFLLTDWLELRYVMLMQQYMKSPQFDKPTDISNPFWHLQSDGFWHLQFGEDSQDGVTPSKRWLKEKVTFAYFDDDLWLLLQNKNWRLKIRDYIVEHKLTNDNWLGKIAVEGLGTIAVLLLAA
jgi:putative restriction endonuclease